MSVCLCVSGLEVGRQGAVLRVSIERRFDMNRKLQ